MFNKFIFTSLASIFLIVVAGLGFSDKAKQPKITWEEKEVEKTL